MEETKNINGIFTFRIIILALYSLFFVWLIKSDVIAKYVHPRYNIFILISCVFSVLIIFAMLLSLRTHFHGRISAIQAVFFIIPLLTAFFTMNMDIIYSESFASADTTPKNTVKAGNRDPEGYTEEYVPGFVKEVRKEESIELTEKHFVPILDDIYNNSKKYTGKRIALTGKVLKRKMAPNKEEFAIARMTMVCCAADMQPAEFICRYKDALSINANSWYRISGIFDLVKMEDSEIPVIIVDKAEKTGKPANEFVYPF